MSNSLIIRYECVFINYKLIVRLELDLSIQADTTILGRAINQPENVSSGMNSLCLF